MYNAFSLTKAEAPNISGDNFEMFTFSNVPNHFRVNFRTYSPILKRGGYDHDKPENPELRKRLIKKLSISIPRGKKQLTCKEFEFN